MTPTGIPGKFFILGLEGAIPDKSFVDLIEQYPPSGIIFLACNFESPSRLKKLISDLRSIIGQDAIFAVDQEPGRVQRFKTGFPESKSPREYLHQHSTDDYREWCRQTASLLADIGINLNLAPVVDLLSPDDESPVLSGRSFGDDIAAVNEFAGILIEEHKKAGVLTCAKHFPGLGSARHDPHEELSVSSQPLESFIGRHWRPFRAAAETGCDTAMTTHLLSEAIDKDYPATYSSRAISHLRHTIGFAGPIISDDLIMKGAGKNDNIDNNAIRSLEIGHDLIIISRDVSLQRKAIEGVWEKYQADRAFRESMTSREEIIDKLKTRI